MDKIQRQLEREAAQGDENALERLTHMHQRNGNGRHHDKLGKWICINGVRDHFRGILLGVTELGAGTAHLHLHPAYWLESLASTNNEVKVPTTQACPFDINSEAIIGVSIQPQDWA